jgi:hypothetical protein
MKISDELREMLLEPAKEAITHLDLHRDQLTFEEIVTLEKLKFSIKMYELEKEYKMKGSL